eukprot:4054734-Prymnesium_polylepis.1
MASNFSPPSPPRRTSAATEPNAESPARWLTRAATKSAIDVVSLAANAATAATQVPKALLQSD